MGKYLNDLKGQVAAAEGKIDGMYLELGKKCYELYADSPDEAIKDEIGAIKKTFDEIDTVKGNIEKAEKCEICPDCGSVVPEGFRFCGNCGVKLNLPQEKADEPEFFEVVEEKAEEKSDKKVCKNCGHENESDAMFCEGCGKKLDAEAAPAVKENKCPNCGAEYEEGSLFCTECGTRL